MSRSWLKLHVADWRSAALRLCSPGARGLLVELLCLMHEATPYGHLLISGRAPTTDELATLTAIPSAQLAPLLTELRTQGVLSQTTRGVLYSAAMVKEGRRAQAGRNNVRKRADRGGEQALEKPGKTSTTSRDPTSPPTRVPSSPPTSPPRAREDILEPTVLSEPPVRIKKTEPSVLEKKKPDPDHLDEALAAYAAAAERSGWAQVRDFSPSRQKALRERLAEVGGLEGWRAALTRAERSSHLCGANDRGWRANFDFLVRKSSFNKLLEGQYDDRPPSGLKGVQQHGGTSPHDTLRRWVAGPAGDPRGAASGAFGAEPDAGGAFDFMAAPPRGAAGHGGRGG